MELETQIWKRIIKMSRDTIYMEKKMKKKSRNFKVAYYWQNVSGKKSSILRSCCVSCRMLSNTIEYQEDWS